MANITDMNLHIYGRSPGDEENNVANASQA